MTRDVEFGVLLPHFSAHGSRRKLFEGTQLAEELGFDLAYVRDLLYISTEVEEHGGIHEPGFFTEALTTLASLTSITDSIKLGTAVLIPNRHPVKAAQIFGTLSYLSDGRIVAGIGAGWDKTSFDPVDVPFEERAQLVRENAAIFRRLWNETDVSYDGELFSFKDVTINPRPETPPPILYGGLSYVAVRRAAEYCDGWLPSRMPFFRLADRIDRYRQLADQHNRPHDPVVGVIPQTSVAQTTEDALDAFDFPAIKRECLNRKPIAGDRTDFDLDELRGFYIAGEPAEICEDIERFLDLGVDQITFDMRASFSSYEENLHLLGDEVIPQFR